MLIEAQPVQRSVPVERQARWYADTTRLLRIEIWLIVLIPSRYVIGPLGGIGWPATLGGIVLLGAWAVGTLAGPARVASVPAATGRPRGGLGDVDALVHADELPQRCTGTRPETPIASSSACCRGPASRSRRPKACKVPATASCWCAPSSMRSRSMALIALLQFRLGWEPIDLLGKIPAAPGEQRLRRIPQPIVVPPARWHRRPSHRIRHHRVVGTGLFDPPAAPRPDRSRLRRWVPFGMIAWAFRSPSAARHSW